MIQSCGIKNRVQCVSVPNEHLCTDVVAYFGWQRISFECREHILIALPYNSMHMLITQHDNSEVSFYILQCNALLYIHNWCRLLCQTLFTTLQAIHHYIYIVFFLLQSIVLDVPHFKYFWLLIVT